MGAEYAGSNPHLDVGNVPQVQAEMLSLRMPLQRLYRTCVDSEAAKKSTPLMLPCQP